MRINYNIEISKPAEEVFLWIAEPEKAMQWQKNVKRINTWINRNSKIHDYLEYFGFNNKSPVTYFSYLNKNTNQIIDNFNNWNISMIDSDVY